MVFGSSSGAIVALQVLAQHPEVVGNLIAHEQPAMGMFLTSIMSESDREMLKRTTNQGDLAQMARDFDYWFEHELRQYPAAVFDMAALEARSNQVLFAADDDTAGLMPHRVSRLFAHKLDTSTTILPGGHIGYATRVEAFAATLIPVLNGWPMRQSPAR